MNMFLTDFLRERRAQRGKTSNTPSVSVTQRLASYVRIFNFLQLVAGAMQVPLLLAAAAAAEIARVFPPPASASGTPAGMVLVSGAQIAADAYAGREIRTLIYYIRECHLRILAELVKTRLVNCWQHLANVWQLWKKERRGTRPS